MPPEGRLLEMPRRWRLQPVARPRLRVADVAPPHGRTTAALRAYLEAKAAFAREHGAIEHHLLAGRAGGSRLPLASRDLLARLEAAQPDVVLLHEPLWHARELCRLAHANGAAVVMVHHRSAQLDGGSWATPSTLCARARRRWQRGVYQSADAVMAASDPWTETGRRASIPLRFGLHPAFRPQPGVARGDHVLVAGRLSREKGILTLVEAAARSSHGWPLRIAGGGPAVARMRTHARRLGVEQRLQVRPARGGEQALARAYAAASCVVVPGADEMSLQARREASACASPVVACGGFRPGDAEDLLAAIERARGDRPSHAAAASFARAHSWERVLSAELRDLEALAGW